jgi:hypothetical protein
MSTPHVGRLSRQVNTSRSHLIAKNNREPKITPRRQEEASGTDENIVQTYSNLYEPTTSRLGRTGHVNLFQDVKVNSS